MRELLLIMALGLVSVLCQLGRGYVQSQNLNTENAPHFVNVNDFGARGDLRSCADAQIIAGSKMLFSPKQCNFSSADVNKWVQVPLAGDSFGTGLSAQIVSVQNSQNATLSTSAGATLAVSPKTYTDLQIHTNPFQNQFSEVFSVTKPFMPKQLGTTITITGGTGFRTGTYRIIGVDTAGRATLSDFVGGAGGGRGGIANSTVYTTIGTGNYAALAAVADAACTIPNTFVLFPPGGYYIEKYRVDSGPNANGVSHITWQYCNGVTISGYGATLASNGAFRRLADSGKSQSFENTVTPLRIIDSTDVTVLGLELDGDLDYMTKDLTVAEGQNYGLISGNNKNLMIRDLNTHNWSTDGIIIGSLQGPHYLSDQVVTLDHVWSHNNGRMGLTVANVNKLDVFNYNCSQIGKVWTGNAGYNGHPPEGCVDIEPPVGNNVPIGNVHFIGGHLTTAYGASFYSTAGCCDQLTVEGMTFDNGAANNNYGRGSGPWGVGVAKWTVYRDNVFFSQQGQGFGCGPDTRFNPYLGRTDFVNNAFYLETLAELGCGANDDRIHPTYFIGNHLHVSGEAVANGSLNLDHMREVAGNDFYIDAKAKFKGTVTVINYQDTENVHDNVYSTNLTNAADPYSVNYRGVRYWRNEHSLNPEYFLVTSEGGRKLTSLEKSSVATPATPVATGLRRISH